MYQLEQVDDEDFSYCTFRVCKSDLLLSSENHDYV